MTKLIDLSRHNVGFVGIGQNKHKNGFDLQRFIMERSYGKEFTEKALSWTKNLEKNTPVIIFPDSSSSGKVYSDSICRLGGCPYKEACSEGALKTHKKMLTEHPIIYGLINLYAFVGAGKKENYIRGKKIKSLKYYRTYRLSDII
jgi:hypothetical protein